MEPPNMNPLLHWGNYGIITGFHFLDPLGGLGCDGVYLLRTPQVAGFSFCKGIVKMLDLYWALVEQNFTFL